MNLRNFWKQAEQIPDPIPCPWCGGEMEPGYVAGSGIYWAPGPLTRSARWFRRDMPSGSLPLDDIAFFKHYPLAWYCRGCRKIVVDAPEPYRPEGDKVETPQENEEEGDK